METKKLTAQQLAERHDLSTLSQHVHSLRGHFAYQTYSCHDGTSYFFTDPSVQEDHDLLMAAIKIHEQREAADVARRVADLTKA